MIEQWSRREEVAALPSEVQRRGNSVQVDMCFAGRYYAHLAGRRAALVRSAIDPRVKPADDVEDGGASCAIWAAAQVRHANAIEPQNAVIRQNVLAVANVGPELAAENPTAVNIRAAPQPAMTRRLTASAPCSR